MKRILSGHPWIYDNEIKSVSPDVNDGDIVDIFDWRNKFVGKGYFNSKSRIRIRILTRTDTEIDRSFFEAKLRGILRRKKEYRNGSFRLIHSEGDGIPGLIVDKYSNFLVIQVNTLGMMKLKSIVVDVLVDLLNPRGIYEKSDSPSLKKEGVKEEKGWIYLDGPSLIPFEYEGIKFFADVEKGQKTGFFLDQRGNALLLRKYAESKRCLDVFSYHANFAMNLLKGGAIHVELVETSKRANDNVELMMKINDFKNFKIIDENAFDYLRKLDREKERYDIVVLDPPAFAKSNSNKEDALRGYKEINLRAMKILRNGGILATSSCSQVVKREEFENVLKSAAKDVKKKLILLHRGGQPPDHTILLNVDETEYLKFYIFKVVDLGF
ncbi:MAG TPA: class I SAM-dependent rRNA methyltransferase [Thermotogales bacterium]|nr:class I SAM-dependent rRNA methyltransferase [Thermotogales bacterium]